MNSKWTSNFFWKREPKCFFIHINRIFWESIYSFESISTLNSFFKKKTFNFTKMSKFWLKDIPTLFNIFVTINISSKILIVCSKGILPSFTFFCIHQKVFFTKAFIKSLSWNCWPWFTNKAAPINLFIYLFCNLWKKEMWENKKKKFNFAICWYERNEKMFAVTSTGIVSIFLISILL